MRKLVVKGDGWDLVDDYIGKWYEGQYNPQDLYLEINCEREAEIVYDPEIGRGTRSDVWHRRTLWIGMSGGIISIEESNKILDDLKPLIVKLEASYEEKWDGNNHIGHWDQEIVQEIRNYLYKFETELFWIDEEDMQEEIEKVMK